VDKFHKDSYAASFAQALAFKLHKMRRSYESTVDKFIFSSDFVLREYLDHGFDRKKTKVIPLYTDALQNPPRFDDDGYILYYGRLVEEKGVQVLLKALEGMPGVPCKIVGTGPEEDHLHIEGDRMPHVRFEGYQAGETLWNLVCGARAVVVPSLWPEVFGMVAIEAMAMGKPVVATPVVTSGIDASPGENIVIADGPAEFAGKVIELLDNRALRERIGAAARRLMETEHSWEKLADRLNEVLVKAAAKKPPAWGSSAWGTSACRWPWLSPGEASRSPAKRRAPPRAQRM